MRHFLLIFLVLVAAGLAAPLLHAQSAAEIARQKTDLQELRGRLDTLRKELSASEESRADVTTQLKQSEEQISTAQRQLNSLKKEQQRLQGTLRDLKQEGIALEQARNQQQQQLERLLYRQYTQGSSDTLEMVLNGDDPNLLARDLYYLRIIAQARAVLLSDIRATLKRQQQLTEEAKEKATELDTVKNQQEEEHAHLLTQRNEHQQVLTRISGQIKTQRQQIDFLKKDEKRLNQVIEQLTRLLAEQERKAAAARKAREKAEQEARRAAGKAKGKPGSVPENTRLPTATSGQFAQLKGRLVLPVKGKVTAQYGAAREEGGTWKGLFISAPRGNEFKAIAKGQVVYAEWMRGLGNLIIINHDDGYMTVYGHADALFRQVGDRVEGGETIGSTGNSGGHPETGLYFELRHQGATLNPMQWISLK
ncbi:MAG: peptidoglycan DD-metalloendopeptidase family protein [Zoogloeaceae bacterium]|jgi:septal ring factor EnvC (AmiA/AmiB activator)|nr:peptidoglycan DD-metalloendopeptidase family protein [Zoogloeaceae bacterium]